MDYCTTNRHKATTSWTWHQDYARADECGRRAEYGCHASSCPVRRQSRLGAQTEAHAYGMRPFIISRMLHLNQSFQMNST